MAEAIIQFLISPDQSGIYSLFKILFNLFSLLLIIAIILILIKTKWFKLFFWYDFIEFFTLKIYGGVLAGFRWNRLKKKAIKHKGNDYKYFIIKSHNILDKLLKRLVPTWSADNYSERLARVGTETFSNLEDLWWAHELYKKVIRKEINNITVEEFKKLINTYNHALIELEVINK